MELREVNFETLQSVRKKCITFAKDGNTVVKPYKTLYNLEQITNNPAHKNLYIEVVHGKESWEEDSYCVFEDFGEICNKVGWVPRYYTFEKFVEQLKQYSYLGKEGFFKRLKEAEDNGCYINKLDIELCFILGKTDLAKHYMEYRDELIAEREEKERIRQAKVDARKREEEQKYLAEIENALLNAEDAIKTKTTFFNDKIDGNTIVLRLLKKYNVNVPIKTQGWINKALARVFYRDGKISYSYFKTSKDSTVFYGYLKELENKILAA